MADTIIDKLYKDNESILSYLIAAKEVSMYSDLDDKLKKVLVMSAASFFEKELKSIIEAFVSQTGNDNPALLSLVKNKAIERQFHTYFNWNGASANTFFSIFGEVFSTHCRAEVKRDETLANAVAAFMELGATRNQLAHMNFGAFPVQKTSSELYSLYKTAVRFIDFVRKKLLDENGIPAVPGVS
jgi:RiboL-PSP-HEPN